MHVVRAETFDDDADALFQSLGELSELAATNTLIGILQASARLSILPNRHPLEPLDPQGRLRRFNIGRYVVLYDVTETRVELVHVLPGEMDMEAFLRRTRG
jgi:plasmid stabilization system protein ParE